MRADRRLQRHNQTIEEILDLAIEVMAEDGVAALSLAEVARRMGMRPPSLYQYFPSKLAVYDALFAMQDGSLFRTYRVIDDCERPDEVFVLVRDDLVMKIRVNRVDSFEVTAIGPCGNAADPQTGWWYAV